MVSTVQNKMSASISRLWAFTSTVSTVSILPFKVLFHPQQSNGKRQGNHMSDRCSICLFEDFSFDLIMHRNAIDILWFLCKRYGLFLLHIAAHYIVWKGYYGCRPEPRRGRRCTRTQLSFWAKRVQKSFTYLGNHSVYKWKLSLKIQNK